MLYEQLMDLALDFADGIILAAMNVPLGDLDEENAPTKADVLSRPQGLFRGERLVVPPSIQEAFVKRVARATPLSVSKRPKAKSAASKLVKKTLKVKKAEPAMSSESKVDQRPSTGDEVFLKHLFKKKLVRSDKLKTKTGLPTASFVRGLEDLVRRGIVVGKSLGSHRHYALA